MDDRQITARRDAHAWAILDQMDDAVVVTDELGRITTANDAALRLFALPAERMLGLGLDEQPWRVFDATGARVEAKHRPIVAALRGESAVGEYLVAGVDGREHWQWARAVPLRGDGGEIRGAIVVIRDATARHELEEALRRSEEQLRVAAERRLALLRATRRLAAAVEPDLILRQLLDEAVATVDGDGGTVYRWDQAREQLIAVKSTRPECPPGTIHPVRTGVAGGSAQARRPVIINEYSGEDASIPSVVSSGAKSAIGVPLLHEGTLLGVVAIFSRRPEHRFDAEDADLLEVLAGTVSAVLVGQERSRLEGVLLAARTAQHEMSNQLARTVGYTELLATNQRLPAELRELADEALQGALGATALLARLQRLSHLAEHDQGSPSGSVIDLTRSERAGEPT